MPTLYIFSGLPGTGKTTLSQALAKQITAVHLRVDTVEQALRDLCAINVQGEGYRLLYRVAADNLRLGNSVVADSCNPIELTRNEWENVALESGASYVNIVVVCSDKLEHRNRVENRSSSIPGLIVPTWKDVESREYHVWSKERIVIDTAGKSENECLASLLSSLLDLHAYNS
jgi:predicted kinase